MNLTIKTNVSYEAIKVADLRTWLALDSTDQDTMLATIVISARMKIEKLTGTAIGARTYTYTAEMFDNGVMELPFPPVVSISSVKVDNGDGTTDTIDSGSYTLKNNILGYLSGAGSVLIIEYITGVTATELEKQLILKQAAWDYTHRGDSDALPYSPDVMQEIQFVTRNTGW